MKEQRKSTPMDLPESALLPVEEQILTPEEVGARYWESYKARQATRYEDLRNALRNERAARHRLENPDRELRHSVDPHDLSKTGWGVIVAEGKKDRVRRWLQPLLKRRKEQAKTLYRIEERRRRESADQFLRSKHESPGTVDERKLPYYLLIVGSPDEIPFEFQYELGLSRAVGRLSLETSVQYQAYARAVCRAEEGGASLPRKASLFSVENDPVTEILGRWLVRPLHRTILRDHPEWELDDIRGKAAKKARLKDLLGGDSTPALALISSHGRRIRPSYPELQREFQGSPMCVPDEEGDELFSAADLVPASRSKLHGLIAFLFGCYTAGTPDFNDFPHEVEGRGPEAALRTTHHLMSQKPFLARLPTEMLCRGALAVVGNVDRAWTTSCRWSSEGKNFGATSSLEDALGMLLSGHRLGHALRPLHRRYAQLGARLSQMQDSHRVGIEPNLTELGFYWTALNDARNTVILGDPAVYALGRRMPDHIMRLDPILAQRIQQQLRGSNDDVQAFVERAIRRSLGT